MTGHVHTTNNNGPEIDVARWKSAAPEQLTGAHLYLDIAKLGYLFHGYSGGMR